VSKTAKIDGIFAGILETDALVVHDNAKMSGEIIADSLVIDSGADITGVVMRKTPLV
jgi:cytoskeletal protein CcmA (bactofilin family)